MLSHCPLLIIWNHLPDELCQIPFNLLESLAILDNFMLLATGLKDP